MISAARSRNIRFDLFVQSKNQLVLRYAEESETILSNCTNWIFLFSREIKFLQELSELCGVRYTDNGKRPLLDIAELQQLSKEKGDVLLLIGRYKPYLGRLLDIDLYEREKYRPRTIPGRVQIHREEIDFTVFEETELTALSGRSKQARGDSLDIPERGMSGALDDVNSYVNSLPMSNEEIDKLIVEIDKKLEELDKEEQGITEQLEKEKNVRKEIQKVENKRSFWDTVQKSIAGGRK